MLGIEFRALCMLGKYSTTEIHPQPYFYCLSFVVLGLKCGCSHMLVQYFTTELHA
jgi:hypothetical protein